MKKICCFLFLMVILPLEIHAQTKAVIVNQVAMTVADGTATNGPTWSLLRQTVTQHMMMWYSTGTVSTGACGLQSSATSNMASPSDLIAAQTVTSTGGGSSLLTSGVANYVRIHCSTAITGSGTVWVIYEGFADNPVGATFTGTISVGDVNVHDGAGTSIGSTSNALDVNVKSGAATGVAQGSTTSGQSGPLTQAAVTTAAPSYTTAQTSPLSLTTAGSLRVADTVANVAQASTTSGQSGTMVQCASTTSSPSYTNATTNPINCDTSGNIRVNVVAGSAANSAASATGSAVPANAGYTGVNVGGTQRGLTAHNSSGSMYAADVYIDPASLPADAAELATVSTNPVPMGIVYESSPTALTNGQVAYALADTAHRQVVVGPGTAGTAAGGVVTVQGVASMTPILNTPPANQSMNLAQIAGSTAIADPCAVNAKVYTPINLTANTTLITGTSAKKIYICALNLVVAAATNVGIVSGTGTTCGTNTVANISGGTTAATGWNFAANAGIALGNGASALSATTVNADNLCVLVSAANQTSGMIVSVVQ